MSRALLGIALVLLGPASAPPLPPAAQRGPRVGRPLPAFQLPDQDGRPQTFASLKGPKGLMLVLVQSADW